MIRYEFPDAAEANTEKTEMTTVMWPSSLIAAITGPEPEVRRPVRPSRRPCVYGE